MIMTLAMLALMRYAAEQRQRAGEREARSWRR